MHGLFNLEFENAFSHSRIPNRKVRASLQSGQCSGETVVGCHEVRRIFDQGCSMSNIRSDAPVGMWTCPHQVLTVTLTLSQPGGRLCPPYTAVHTKFRKPQAHLGINANQVRAGGVVPKYVLWDCGPTISNNGCVKHFYSGTSFCDICCINYHCGSVMRKCFS